MASWGSVYNGLRAQVINALSGYVPPANITIGYPATFIAQTSGQPSDLSSLSQTVSQAPLVFIYDRGMAKDVTRWIPRNVNSYTPVTPTINFSLTGNYLPSNGSVTLEITDSAAANDAIGVSFSTGSTNVGAVFTAATAVSKDSVATGLADEINGLGLSLNAVVDGNSITINNPTNTGFTITAATANISTALYEVHRVKRSTQVIVLANRPETLDTVSEPLVQLFGELEVTYGYDLSDGTYVRLMNAGDIMLWDNVLSNIARRDFMLTLEYGVNLQNVGYEVLASTLQFDNGFTLGENLQ